MRKESRGLSATVKDRKGCIMLEQTQQRVAVTAATGQGIDGEDGEGVGAYLVLLSTTTISTIVFNAAARQGDVATLQRTPLLICSKRCLFRYLALRRHHRGVARNIDDRNLPSIGQAMPTRHHSLHEVFVP